MENTQTSGHPDCGGISNFHHGQTSWISDYGGCKTGLLFCSLGLEFLRKMMTYFDWLNHFHAKVFTFFSTFPKQQILDTSKLKK